MEHKEIFLPLGTLGLETATNEDPPKPNNSDLDGLNIDDTSEPAQGSVEQQTRTAGINTSYYSLVPKPWLIGIIIHTSNKGFIMVAIKNI